MVFNTAAKTRLILLAVMGIIFSSYSISKAQSDMPKTSAIEQAITEAAAKTDVNVSSEDSSAAPTEKDYRYASTSEREVIKAPKDINFLSDTYFRYMPNRKVEAMPGKIGIMKAESQQIYERKVGGKLPVQFSLDTEYISIKNTTSVELPAHLTGMSVDIQTTLPFFAFEDLYIRLGVNPSYYTEYWDFNSSAFRIPSREMLIYQPNDKWTFVAGVAVCPDYETKVWPIFGFIYKPNDKLTFNLVPETPTISYKLNDKLTVFGELGLTVDQEFEVKKGDLNNVILKYKESRLGTGVRYEFNKYIRSSVTVGGVFNRRLQYRDSLGKVNIDDTIYSEFRFDIVM